MSDYVLSRHGGSLLLAENAADERTVSRALRDYDDRLRLTWEIDQQTGRQVWNVHYVWSQDHPARQILTWREDGAGAPLPLTMRLVDEVRKLREHETLRTADDRNTQLAAAHDRETYENLLEVTTEFERLDRTGRIHVPHRVGSNALAQARSRGRKQGMAE